MDPNTPIKPAPLKPPGRGQAPANPAAGHPVERPAVAARAAAEPDVEVVVAAEAIPDVPIVLPPPAKKAGKGHPIARLIRKIGLGAFTTSLIVHVVFFMLAFFTLYKWIYPPEEKIDFLPGGGGGSGAAHKVQPTVRQRLASSAVPNARIASTSTTATFALPDSSNNMMDAGLPMGFGSGGGSLSAGSGAGTGLGNGIGKGLGDGQLGIGALIPTIMKGRCSDSERMRMLREAGGSEKVEEGVKKSLAWFKSKQNKDGSWGSRNKPSMTGLVLLCYLGHCESAQSGDYGQNVFEGIIFLIDQASKNNGRMMTTTEGNSGVYEHAIATYALAEALCYSRSLQFPLPELETTVQKATDIIVQGQTSQGGWDYGYADKGRNDLSVVGWQLQALKAAKFSGAKVENLEQCTRKATEYLLKTAYVGDGKFAYTGNGAKPAMTPVGALCLQHQDKGTSKQVREAIKLMHEGLKLRGNKAKEEKAERDKAREEKKEKKEEEKKTPSDFAPLFAMRYNTEGDLYAWYYMVQAMRNAGGEEWQLTNKAILEEILTAQKPDGSFKPEVKGPLSGPGASGGKDPIYLQALDTLILEVYYRFLPATSAGKGHSPGVDDIRGMR